MTNLRTCAVSVLALLSIAAACGGGGGSGGGPADAMGTLAFVPDDTTLPVLEPNDSVDEPQVLPLPRARAGFGGRLELCDAVDPHGDALDAFRFRSIERVRVHAKLARVAGDGRLPELVVYDPVSMRPLRVSANGDVAFVMRGTCDLVVRATDARVQYALRVRTEPVRELREGDRELGQVAAGDELDLVDASVPRRLAFTASEALVLDATALAGGEVRELGSDVVIAPGADGVLAIPALAAVELVLPARTVSNRTSAKLRASAVPAAQPGVQPTARAVRVVLAPSVELEGPSPSAVYGRARLEATRGELLVLPRATAGVHGAFAARGLEHRDAIPGDVELVAFDAGSASDADAARIAVALAESLAGDARIAYAERNLVRHASSLASATTPALGGPVTPNDTHYHLQWHYPLLHLPEAWALTTGSDSVIVAVIDTGETAHPDLAGRQIQGYDFISTAANAGDGDGRDADPTDVGDGNGVQPSSFHGTHVAGTIGAATNNASGVAGVTWFGKVMHLRVLGRDGGTDFDIANAIRYAARLTNASTTLPVTRANVINMSLGGPGASSTVQSAVTAARAQNVVIFAAAGNEDTIAPSYPAAYTGVISVAAVDLNGNRAPYSNFGTTVDIAAPGGDTSADLDNDGFADGVLSTLIDDSGGSSTPVFAFYQGTSMACPHAAGVASLMLAVDPTLTPAAIETVLKDTATDLGAPGRDNLYGNGLIHAERAVLAAQGVAPPAMPVLQLSPQAIAFGTLQSTVSVGVTNAGTGVLDVSSIQIVTTDGGSWLSAIPIAATVATDSDTEAISVHVDRAGLADGNYTGTVTVNSNGGSEVIAVAMTVDASVVPIDVDLFVLAVDAVTFESVQEFVANPTTTLDYVFTGLPEGDYILVAGSDDDDDGFICGEGDTYCGLYPTVNEPETVHVSGNDLSGLDFPVAPAAQMGPIHAPPHGPGTPGPSGFRVRKRAGP